MSTRRTLLAASVTATLSLCFAANAAGDTRTSAWQKLRLDLGDTGLAAWVRHRDSPLDTNTRALKLVVPEQTGDDWAGVFSRASTHLRLPVGRVKNLSFDFAEASGHGRVGAGAPRISAIFANGDVAFLAASTCNNGLAVSGDTWGRADFTGMVANDSGEACGFNVSGDTGGFYAATASESAWQVYADAHPEQVLQSAFLISDEAGTYYVDRLSLATGWMFTRSNTRAVRCRAEASC